MENLNLIANLSTVLLINPR